MVPDQRPTESPPPLSPSVEVEEYDGRMVSFADLFAPGESARPPERLATSLVPPAYPAPRRAPAAGALRIARQLAVVCCKLAVVVMLAWGLVFNFSEVRGSSMEPGIHDRDRILVDHVSYLFGTVDRGDVVVLRYPLDPSLDYIKRVVGLPGDEIVIASGEVRVNGRLLEEPYVAQSSIEPWTTLRTIVRERHYFVLGDNRRRSSDSREFGQVPFEYLRGKVRLRLWPLDRVGLVD